MKIVCFGRAPHLARFQRSRLKLPIFTSSPSFRQKRGATFAAAHGPGLPDELKLALDGLISQNKVVVFMKGTKQFPQCGFSNTVVQILNTVNAQFETVNVLENDVLRAGMKEYSQWPTFPQVYIDGEFFGGCDIMIGNFLLPSIT
eukprot:g2143.t1